MITTKPIDIEDAHADILQNALKEHLPEGVHVYAFGSRANWQVKRASDLDLAIDANDALKRNIGNLEEELSLSALPYKVDIVNLNSISDSFRKAIMNDLVAILWDWRKTEISRIAEVIGGGTPRTSVAEYWNGNIPWLTPRDLTGYNDTYIAKGERGISDLGLQRSSARLLPAGTVLLTSRAPIGYIALAKNIISTNQGFKNLVVNSEHAYNLFVYYWLKHNIKNLKAIGTGTTFMEISGSVVKAIRIALPPLSEQKAIASVLSSLDDKIDLLHRQNKTLESMAEVIFRKWFIEDADDSWEEVNLSQIADIICGKTPSKKRLEYFCGNVPFIKIPDMRDNTYISQTTDSLTKSGQKSQSNKTIPPFSICVSCIATVGLVSMNVIESQTNQQINTVVPHKEIYRYYLFCYLRNSFDMLQTMGSGGTATLNINTDSFSKMNINKPNDITLKSFSNKVSTIFNKILLNQKQIKTLESLRSTLLPKLMSGSIRVKYEAS